ncbi:hypothetical protein ABEB36_003354 [Hypothenemus hampei]|uniref:CCC domain-containing protein n=1 Tax=Hypothenemus hampei TaxID=57062 RepID=A0ABD1FC03_HYPHA
MQSISVRITLPYVTVFVLSWTIFRTIMGNPLVRDDVKRVKYEEYIIEHEISATQARNSALSANVNNLNVPAGCQECTKEERHYCTSADLISDHCCCDKKYHEYLPYIPHTCYFGTQLCTTIAQDCNRYTRLRTCCCDKLLIQKYKNKYGFNNGRSIKPTRSILIVLMLFYKILHRFLS